MEVSVPLAESRNAEIVSVPAPGVVRVGDKHLIGVRRAELAGERAQGEQSGAVAHPAESREPHAPALTNALGPL